MANFYLPDGKPFVTQGTLPRNMPKREYVPATGNFGLYLGIVKQVNYKIGKVDVALTSNQQGDQGRLVTGAPMVTSFFGNDMYGNYFGEANYPQEGSYVLVAFLSGQLSSPIIIGTYPNSVDAYQNIAPTELAYHTDQDPQYQQWLWARKTVYPSQQFSSIMGNGDYYRTFGGMSFLQVARDTMGYMVDDSYDGTMNGNLYNQKTGKPYAVDGKAQRWLLLHQSNTTDDFHRTRFFINDNGAFEFSQSSLLDDRKLIKLQSSYESGVLLTRQFDTSTYGESSQYSQFYLTSDNHVELLAVQGDSIGSVEVTPGGTLIDGVRVASQTSFQELSKQYDSVSTGVTNLKTQLDKMNPDELAQLPGKVDSVARDTGTNTADISTLKSSTATNTSNIGAVSDRLDKVQENTSASIGDTNKKVTNITQRLTNYEDTVSTVNNINGSYAKTKQEADDYALSKSGFLTVDSKPFKDVSALTASLTTTVANQGTDIGTLKTNQTTATNNIKGLAEAVTAVTKQVTDLTATTATLKALQNLNDNVNALAKAANVTLPHTDIFA